MSDSINLTSLYLMPYTYGNEREKMKKAIRITGAVLLVCIVFQSNALGMILFFAIGWYAKSKYDLKEKKVAKPRKKANKQA